ncbi:MAG: T9SS type A sorting domain-containing protein [Porphyromonadaceae bacterium]|nr:T9SS type A sorting domain-containing protein [Porphyromonadaceae bacterium]
MIKILQFNFITLLLFCVHSQLFSQQMGDTLFINDAKFELLTENLIQNPGFEDGFSGWTDASPASAPLSSSNFTIYTSGGIDNSKFLVGLKNESASSAGSIGTGWPIETGKKYYFSYNIKYVSSAAAGNENYIKVSLTSDKTSFHEPKILLNSAQVNSGGAWTKNEVIFTNSDPDYAFIVARFRWLNNRMGFDNFSLFEVKELVNTAGLQAKIDEANAIYNPNSNGATELQTAITTAESFLSSESTAEVIKAISNLDEAILIYKSQNASAENPLDMTGYIINPGFDNNTAEGWKGIGVISYREVEFYQKTFNMYQKITGLPAGKYKLKVQGFERPKLNDAGNAYKAGTETIYAKFYAKATSFLEKNTPFNSVYKHNYYGTGSLNGYVNTMAAAEAMLTNQNMYYDTSVTDILLNAGDTLTIGARSDFQQNGYWALFDNFRLDYLGAYDNNDLVNELNNQTVIANELLSEKMQNSAKKNLSSAIAYAQQTLEADPLVYEDLVAANDSINDNINTANSSISAYKNLEKAIEDGLIFLETATGAKAQSVQTAVTNGQNTADNLDVALSEIHAATNGILSLINKKIYIPGWMLGNVNDPNNNWSLSRSKQSKNWIIFWEPGYGEDPSVVADGGFRIDIDGLLNNAENFYRFYTDSLKFITPGASKTDDYKMIIRLRYTRDWEATGSGVDNMIGLLTLTAWSAQAGGHTLAHEVAHCFQYQVHCDNNNQDGWMYGFGVNASGGNGWWEQCAQWQAFKIYPGQQFTVGRYANYLRTAHKHILHEAPRYDNYFIQDYMTYKHGMDFIGKLWNKSKRPEDPVEAYKRLTFINQSQFNDEMYERAARFATWDIPALKAAGANYFNARPQPKMKMVEDNFWQIDSTVCIENYGYNVIKLNVPTTPTTLTAIFSGKAGINGFRKLNISQAGWRYGFVALQTDGTRVYSEMRSVRYLAPNDTLHFESPGNIKNLWLVVSGAPNMHWRHAWDDDDSNDEQWPYQVKFYNTNRLGYMNIPNSVSDKNIDFVKTYTADNTLYINDIPANSSIRIFTINGSEVLNKISKNSEFSVQLNQGVYIINIVSGETAYNRKIIIK